MRRILMLLTVSVMMAAMLVVSALPALAIPRPSTTADWKPNGKYYCLYGLSPVREAFNVPRGIVPVYEAAGYNCTLNADYLP